MTQTLLIILLSPLLAAALIALGCRRRGHLAAALSILSAGVQMVLTLSLLLGGWDGSEFHVSMPWLELGNFGVNMGFLLTPLAGLLLFVVTFVGFWIHVFAYGYSDHDEARGRFFGGLSIFMFSMTGIVLADNLLMLFVFWELVGFSSYMLIGHYLTPEAAAASKKAFIVNRVGDFGFLLGIIWCFWHYGTVSLAEPGLPAAVTNLGPVTIIGLLLLCGVIGKSAQMPLHVWLPDAMAGPTPVSALIHAATMVAAGVYLLGRVYFVFTPEALQVVLVIGLATALFAAFCAFGQDDIKKILAYSTLSQLGFMVAAFALGTRYGAGEVGQHAATAGLLGVGAAMFHLTTHAFFKALMFLGAGSVIHATHHEQDIYRMGGLWRRMPVTFITFLCGVLAIAGVPLLSGFFSKDAILLLAWRHDSVAFYLLVFTSLLTATYMGRLLVVAFLGRARHEHAEHAHESPWHMLLPLLVLAVGAVAAGYTGLYPHSLSAFLGVSVPHAEESEHGLMIGLSLGLSLGGLLIAWLLYNRPSETRDTLARRVPALYRLAASKLYFDEVYGFYVRNIQQRVANVTAFLEYVVIQGTGVRTIGGALPSILGGAVRMLHTGSVQTYVFWFAAGVIALWLYAAGIF